MVCTASADPRRRRIASATLCFAVLCICSPATANGPAAAKGDRAPEAALGVLPVAGAPDSATARRLAQSIAARLQQRTRRRVLGPIAVGRRLAAHPETRIAIKRLQDQLRAAADATLQMDRPAALRATTAAQQAARASFATLHEPPLMVRLHVSRALALLLEPADPAAARQAFVAALAIDPRYQPGGGGLAPRAERLLQQAREKARLARAPTVLSRAEAAAVVQRARLAQIVQVTIEPERGPAASVTAALFSSSGRRTAVKQTLAVQAGAPASEQLTPMIAGLLGLDQPERPTGRDGKGGSRRPKHDHHRSAAGLPWYRRWWVWTAAGAVLAAAGVGLAVGLTREGGSSSGDRREPVTLRVEFK